MEGEPVRNKILVVGDGSTHKDKLIKTIVDVQPIPHLLSAEHSLTLPGYSWTIDTKYYTANVEFLPLDAESHSLHSFEHLTTICEALVIVIHSEQRSSSQFVKNLEQFIQQSAPSVMLCVGNVGGRNEEETYCAEWCIENGVEWISMLNEGESEEKENSEGPFREMFGVDRVIEALHTNMWPNMVYKTEQRPIREEGVSEYDTILDKAKEAISKLTVAEDGYLEKQGGSEGKMKQGGEGKVKQEEGKESTVGAKMNLSTEELIEESFNVGGEEEEEDEIDLEGLETFEETMKNLISLRDKSKHLPDKERRDLAARVALSFLGQFE